MSTVWFTADPHFGHGLVSGKRGFSDVEAHDAAIVENFQRLVSDRDEVWWLGDICLSNLGPALEKIREIPGTHHLVAGNHDGCHPMHRRAHIAQPGYLRAFASVQAFARRRVEGVDVLLSHFPYAHAHEERDAGRYLQWRLQDAGAWLLHGHTHSERRLVGKSLHVGLDAWNLRPVPLSRVAEYVRRDGQGEAR